MNIFQIFNAKNIKKFQVKNKKILKIYCTFLFVSYIILMLTQRCANGVGGQLAKRCGGGSSAGVPVELKMMCL